MSEEIKKELFNIGLTNEEIAKIASDPAKGRFIWKPSNISGSFMYENLDVEAIRYLTNWQVTGTIQSVSRPNRPIVLFSLSLEEQWLRIQIATWNWEISVNDPSIRIINSSSSAELSVVFASNYSRPGGYITQGSFIIVKDLSV